MSGIENILKQINNFGDGKCNEIINNANERANEIIDEANITAKSVYNSETDKINIQIKNKTETDIAYERSNSLRKILDFKVNAVNNTLKDTVDYLNNLDTDEYFDFLSKLYVAYKPLKECTLYLSERDLLRCPQSFKESLDGYVTLSLTPCEINGGFILSYGDVTENCSFDAICSANIEKIKDSISNILFLNGEINE